MTSPRIPRTAAQENLDHASDQADPKTRFEEQSYLLAKANTELAQARVISVQQDIGERKTYASKIFRLICFWVGGLLLIVCLSSWSAATRFLTPTPVLLALVGSTSLNVLGLFYIVAHYLFPDRGRLESATLPEQEQVSKGQTGSDKLVSS